NCTVPVGALPLTVAVKATPCPNDDGLIDEATLVVVGVGPTAPVVARPMRLPSYSVNHKFPSGPLVMTARPAPAVIPVPNSATAPSAVMRPMRLPALSVNHRLPSGPSVMP